MSNVNFQKTNKRTKIMSNFEVLKKLVSPAPKQIKKRGDSILNKLPAVRDWTEVL